MDIPRPDFLKRKKKRQLLLGAGGLLLVASLSLAFTQIKPARPTVNRSAIWLGTVQRADLIREVRGLGSLVPENIQRISAASDARVEKIHLLPGSSVTADTILVSLSNPELAQSALDANAKVTTAEAEIVNLQAQLQSQLLERESEQASAEGEFESAQAEVAVNARLAEHGLISRLELQKSQITLRQLATRAKIAARRTAFCESAIAPQLAVQQSALSQARAQAQLRQTQLDALQVRASIDGVLQEIVVQPGQRILAGASLARVADPAHLQAQIRIPENQARDIVPGLTASIDTRNGLLSGTVSRINPTVENGTVTIDIRFTDALPSGLRTDQSVEGVVQIERLPQVLQIARPAGGGDGEMITLFKIGTPGEAHRTRVQLGRGSVNAIAVLSGLQLGDQVILSQVSVSDTVSDITIH